MSVQTWTRVGPRRLRVHNIGTGPTVLLEPGGGLPGTTAWTPVTELLQDSAHLLAYDRAGLGDSDALDAPPTTDDHLRDLHAVLTEHAPEQPVLLVGWSLGGLIVELYARRHPDRVVGMVLVDPTPVELFTSLAPGWVALRTTLRAARLLAAARGARQDASPTPETARSELSALPAACRQLQGARSRGPALAAPVTVLSAEVRPSPLHRPLLRAAHAATAKLFTHGRLVVVDGASHTIPAERPELVASHVRALIACGTDRP